MENNSKQLSVAKEKIILTELGDGTGVLLHLGTKFYYTLNATGVFVWKLIASQQATTADDIASHLQQRFAVSHEQAKTDARLLLQELIAEELLASS